MGSLSDIRKSESYFSFTPPKQKSRGIVLNPLGANLRLSLRPSYRWIVIGTGGPLLRLVTPMLEYLMPGFEDHIKRRFCGASNPAESSCLDHFGEFPLSGLGAQCHTDLLRSDAGTQAMVEIA
jgi:hypothetical protein